MVRWYDTTTYSSNDKERVPRVWQANVGKFRLAVHRHKDWPADQWLATCDHLFDCFELASKDVDEAKCQAAAKLQAICEEAINVIFRERHYHVAGDGYGDTCQKCGEDIRSEIHFRVGEAD